MFNGTITDLHARKVDGAFNIPIISDVPDRVQVLVHEVELRPVGRLEADALRIDLVRANGRSLNCGLMS